MKKLNISLSQPDSPMASLAGPTPAPDYPTFHYSGPEELELPKEGTMTIRYKKTRSAESEQRSGKTVYDCTVTVLEIIGVSDSEPKAPSKKYDEAGDALDKLMAEKEGEE